MAELSIASYNCKYFDRLPSKLDFMKNIFKTSGFLYLQECWLFESQFHTLCLKLLGKHSILLYFNEKKVHNNDL